ncbi:MAG: YciI family protein [Bacteroidota bacterium]
MEASKQFMLLFRFTPDFDYQPTEAELQDQQQQWGEFIGTIALQEKLVSTHQLGFEGVKIAADHTEISGIHLADGHTLGGNMVVRASSLEEAVSLAKHCPILQVNGTVEVRSIVPMAS